MMSLVLQKCAAFCGWDRYSFNAIISATKTKYTFDDEEDSDDNMFIGGNDDNDASYVVGGDENNDDDHDDGNALNNDWGNDSDSDIAPLSNHKEWVTVLAWLKEYWCEECK